MHELIVKTTSLVMNLGALGVLLFFIGAIFILVSILNGSHDKFSRTFLCLGWCCVGLIAVLQAWSFLTFDDSSLALPSDAGVECRLSYCLMIGTSLCSVFTVMALSLGLTLIGVVIRIIFQKSNSFHYFLVPILVIGIIALTLFQCVLSSMIGI